MTKIKQGDTFPNFACTTAFSDETTIEAIANGNKLIVWVLRYIGCTVCRYDVHLLAQNYEKFQEKGVNVTVVMQSDPSVVREELKETSLPFEIICDTDFEIYKTLDIAPAASMEALLGDETSAAALQVKGTAAAEAGFSHGLYEGDEQQLPALFILSPQREVLHAHYATNIMDMPTIDTLLKMV